MHDTEKKSCTKKVLSRKSTKNGTLDLMTHLNRNNYMAYTQLTRGLSSLVVEDVSNSSEGLRLHSPRSTQIFDKMNDTFLYLTDEQTFKLM